MIKEIISIGTIYIFRNAVYFSNKVYYKLAVCMESLELFVLTKRTDIKYTLNVKIFIYIEDIMQAI